MKKTRVFLGNAPWSKRDYYGVRAGSRWPHFESEDMTYMPFPFFLAYATAVLENAGFPVMLVDGIAEGIVDKAFYDRIEDFKPDVILLEVSTNSWKKTSSTSPTSRSSSLKPSSSWPDCMTRCTRRRSFSSIPRSSAS